MYGVCLFFGRGERTAGRHTCVQSSKKLEVDAVWKAGFDDLSEGRNLKPVGQSNKVVLYTASVAGALTFSKVGLNGEGRGWTAEISKKGENHKKHMRKSFCFVLVARAK